ITMTAASSINVANAADTLSLTGAITGSFGLTKTGPGLLLLSGGANSYGTSTAGSGTNLNDGTLGINGTGNASQVRDFNGGWLRYMLINGSETPFTSSVAHRFTSTTAGGIAVDQNLTYA